MGINPIQMLVVPRVLAATIGGLAVVFGRTGEPSRGRPEAYPHSAVKPFGGQHV
jgi:hypothetical protein